MPLRFWVEESHRFVRMEAEGVVTDEELLNAMGRVYGHRGVPDGVKILLDARGASAAGVTSVGVARLVDLTEFAAPSTSRAAVVTTDPVVRGMTRMYELRRGDTKGRREIALFEDPDQALDWLEVPREVAAGLDSRS